jgi:integrase
VRRTEHHPALRWQQVPEFVAELKQRDGVAAKALHFAILTAARTNEVIGARWSEFDLAKRIWQIPAARTKMGRDHTVPLSSEAIALLKGLPTEHGSEHCFIGAQLGERLSPRAMSASIERLNNDRDRRGLPRFTDPKSDNGNGPRDITAHGFRSAFSDWAHESTPHPSHVIEMALAQQIGNKVEAAYRRGDLVQKRAALMQDWAGFVSRPVAAGAVVPISRTKRGAGR